MGELSDAEGVRLLVARGSVVASAGRSTQPAMDCGLVVWWHVHRIQIVAWDQRIRTTFVVAAKSRDRNRMK